MKWIIIIVAFISLISCSFRKINFEKVESMMKADPVSALRLLDSIRPRLQKMSVADQMWFYMLETEAHGKHFDIHTNDSTMKLVAEWYRCHGNDEEKSKAYYLLGSVNRDMENYPMSVDWYLRALETLGNQTAYTLRRNILTQLNDVYSSAGNKELAMQTGRQLLQLSLANNNELDIVGAYFTLGFTSLKWNDIPNALKYLNKAVDLNNKNYQAH